MRNGSDAIARFDALKLKVSRGNRSFERRSKSARNARAISASRIDLGFEVPEYQSIGGTPATGVNQGRSEKSTGEISPVGVGSSPLALAELAEEISPVETSVVSEVEDLLLSVDD